MNDYNSMSAEHRQANEEHFFQMIKNKIKLYMWADTGNIYDCSSGKMKPATLKGYEDLTTIVRRPFIDLFVEMPTECNWDKGKGGLRRAYRIYPVQIRCLETLANGDGSGRNALRQGGG